MRGLATSGVKARFTGPRPGGSGEGRCGLPVHPTCRPPMQVPGLSRQLARVTKCKRDFLLNSREASFTTHLGFALRTPESHTAVTYSVGCWARCRQEGRGWEGEGAPGGRAPEGWGSGLREVARHGCRGGSKAASRRGAAEGTCRGSRGRPRAAARPASSPSPRTCSVSSAKSRDA